MIRVLGLKKNLKIDIREKFSIIQKRIEEKTLLLGEVCSEVVIISTCNRTEIYFKDKSTFIVLCFKFQFFRIVLSICNFKNFRAFICGGTI